MKRKLRVTVEIDVSDLTGAERLECAQSEGSKVAELPKLKDTTASDLGRIIADSIPTLGPQFFEGSMIYAKFGDAKIVSAAYK